MHADQVSPHRFHIPVMGTGFMIDAPLRVARYGISSVISLVDDALIEQMRAFHCRKAGEPYREIGNDEDDARACRITAYLDLLNELVGRQVRQLQASPFDRDSEITRYFELLPDSPLSHEYREMLATVDAAERARREDALRHMARPGSIDVNIMSKGDRDHYRDGEKLPATHSDASAALRGFALSALDASVVFSAGMNPRLYGYAAEFPDFRPDADGRLKKRIVLKVSDFHSAAVQGRYLAKRGLWVSEYRVESGLNCGGHAFPTNGLLLGPILDEFLQRKAELIESLHAIYLKALPASNHSPEPLPVRITAQGGIGTEEEDRLLRERYGVDGTGWGTPFLLVPEVTNVDEEHRRKLCDASDDDVYLSDSSPFGMPFWNLRTSASEAARLRRIAEGDPGSPCIKGYVCLFNTEFTARPICTASRQYQRQKLNELLGLDITEQQREALRERVLAKSCICHDLAGGVTLETGIDRQATPAVCCGPNIVNFSRIATLEEMVGHIYGRCSLLTRPDRPHMLLREISLYLEYLQREIARHEAGPTSDVPARFGETVEKLLDGIEHYRSVAEWLTDSDAESFRNGLDSYRRTLDLLAAKVRPCAPS